MFVNTILKVIRSPRKAFKEEISTASVVLYIILSGVILFLYLDTLIKFTLPILESAYPQIFGSIDKNLLNTVYSGRFLILCILYPFTSLFITVANF